MRGWDVDDATTGQHATDLRVPLIPGFISPEVVDPEEAARREVAVQRLDVRVAERGGADVRREEERTVEEVRVGRPHDRVAGLAILPPADVSRGQLNQSNGQVLVAAGIVGAPAQTR